MPSATARSRLCRERQRAGLVVIHVGDARVLVDETALELLLHHYGKLPAHGAKDNGELADALGKLLIELFDADAKLHNR